MRGAGQGVELRSVTKRYGEQVVLRDVDLSLQPARLVTVEGSNGSGKSTLLRLIAGVVLPTSGSVRGLPDRVGYLPERFGPPPLMRSDAYLRHIGRIAGLSGRSARARTDALLELLEIRPDPRHRLGTLSKGNLQKVGLAQVFLAGHQLVVLDEPRTGLETSAWPVLDQLMADQVERGGVVVCSEHDPGVLERATDRWRIRAGALAPEWVTARTGGGGSFRVRADRVATTASSSAPVQEAFPMVAVDGDDGGTLCLRVPQDSKDRLLWWLLRDGWSISAVEAERG